MEIEGAFTVFAGAIGLGLGAVKDNFLNALNYTVLSRSKNDNRREQQLDFYRCEGSERSEGSYPKVQQNVNAEGRFEPHFIRDFFDSLSLFTIGRRYREILYEFIYT